MSSRARRQSKTNWLQCQTDCQSSCSAHRQANLTLCEASEQSKCARQLVHQRRVTCRTCQETLVQVSCEPEDSKAMVESNGRKQWSKAMDGRTVRGSIQFYCSIPLSTRRASNDGGAFAHTMQQQGKAKECSGGVFKPSGKWTQHLFSVCLWSPKSYFYTTPFHNRIEAGLLCTP